MTATYEIKTTRLGKYKVKFFLMMYCGASESECRSAEDYFTLSQVRRRASARDPASLDREQVEGNESGAVRALDAVSFSLAYANRWVERTVEVEMGFQENGILVSFIACLKEIERFVIKFCNVKLNFFIPPCHQLNAKLGRKKKLGQVTYIAVDRFSATHIEKGNLIKQVFVKYRICISFHLLLKSKNDKKPVKNVELCAKPGLKPTGKKRHQNCNSGRDGPADYAAIQKNNDL